MEPSYETRTITELATELNVNESFLYERSRMNALPGLRRLGRFLRVNVEEFYRALENGDLKM